MKVKIIGKEKIEYTSKKTNKEVRGVLLHYTSSIPLAKGEGEKCDNEYVQAELAENIYVGDNVEFLYNRYGTVEEVRVI